MVLGVDEVVLVEDMMLRFKGHYSDSELTQELGGRRLTS